MPDTATVADAPAVAETCRHFPGADDKPTEVRDFLAGTLPSERPR